MRTPGIPRAGVPSERRATVPPQGLSPYKSFSIGRRSRTRGALALSRADAAAKIRAEARSDVVASASRSPLSPNARSCASRSANAFSPRVVAVSRVNAKGISLLSSLRALSGMPREVWRVRARSVDRPAHGSAHLRQPDDLVGRFALRRSWLCGPASRRVC
jgi:hypothetical protein